MTRDTHIPRIHTDVWGEVKPLCEDALGALGVDPSGKVWARTVPQNRDPGYPRVLLAGEQDGAPQYDSHDRWGLRFDLEVRCISNDLVQSEELASEVTTRVTDIESPPEPSGLAHIYTEPLDDVPPEALGSAKGDVFEPIVRTRLYYRTDS